jgi:PAT family beta-lactamase induction signal transducer AmpG
MTAPFVIDLGFFRNEYAAIIKGVGSPRPCSAASPAVSSPVPIRSLQACGSAACCRRRRTSLFVQAMVGHDIAWLTFAITAENFTSAIGTVIYVAYLSALCRNPLHTATQYALLTALAAVGRTYLSATAGYIAEHTGWVVFFAICAAAAIPSLVLLAALQRGGHFKMLTAKNE